MTLSPQQEEGADEPEPGRGEESGVAFLKHQGATKHLVQALVKLKALSAADSEASAAG